MFIYVVFLYMFCYLLFLFIITFFPIKVKKTMPLKILMVLFIGAMLYASYYFIPRDKEDLYRYFEIIDIMKEKSWQWCFFSSKYRYELFSNFLMIITAKIFENNHLFPTIIIGIIYTLLFKMTLNLKKDTEYSDAQIFILTFLSFTIIRHTISGLRNQLGVIFFAYGLIHEYTHKKLTLTACLMYLLSVFSHISMVIFVAIYILVQFANWSRMKVLPYLLILWGSIATVFVKTLNAIPLSVTQFLGNKLNIYIHKQFNGYDMRLYYVQVATVIVLTIGLLYIAKYKKKNIPYLKYNYFLTAIICFLIGSLPFVIFFERGFRLLLACSLPLIIQAELRTRKLPNLFLRYSLLILSFGMFAYQIVEVRYNYPF